jgi:hypothetical protein
VQSFSNLLTATLKKTNLLESNMKDSRRHGESAILSQPRTAIYGHGTAISDAFDVAIVPFRERTEYAKMSVFFGQSR